jgi:heme oxygenase
MILGRLRDETRPWHERAERAMDLPTRLASPAAYAALLARLWGFYAPLEARLDAVGGRELAAIGLDFAPRRKARLLRADLAACGVDPGGLAALPSCAELPALPALPQVLGCLYVLEGATLGGQVIRREVARHLGLGPETGCGFFGGYGAGIGPMWRAFCGTVTDYALANPGAEGAIVAAAAETFQRFEEWLGGGSVG